MSSGGKRSACRRALRTAAALVLPLALAGCERFAHAPSLRFDSEYQAVFLTNGQVFFGKLEHADQPYPRLRDVYYLQTQVNPQTSQVANVVLLKRGAELHAPDLMVLNSRHILAIEPVGRESRIARLIAEGRGRSPAGPGAQPGAPAPATTVPR